MLPQTGFVSTSCMSQAEFEEWCERDIPSSLYRCELIGGYVVMEPPAGYAHSEIASRLGRLLGSFVDEMRLGKVFESSVGFELPTGDTLSPDVSFVSNEHLARVADQDPRRYVRAIPDLVVEVLSPSTAPRDRTDKRAIYEHSGVREYWLVDWEAHTITQVLFEQAREQTLSGTDILQCAVLKGLAIGIERVFA
ncbi:MAG: Uma2 family endonuclease [Planctomycetota bacterium]